MKWLSNWHTWISWTEADLYDLSEVFSTMTILYGPDEDADNLDDESLLKAYLGLQPEQAMPQAITTTALPDWPENIPSSASLGIDHATLHWFQTRHVDWQQEINLVLRAWVKQQNQPKPQ